ERARKGLFEEGISSARMYLDPQRPGVEDILDTIVAGLRSAFAYTGAADVASVQERAVIGVQTVAGQKEGQPHYASWWPPHRPRVTTGAPPSPATGRMQGMTTSDAVEVTLPGGVALPMVGFGTWQLRGRHAYEAVRHALRVGYRHIDTATMYRNEAEIGQAIRDSGVPREQVFVTTKLLPSDAGRERRVIAASLEALGIGYVDLWLIHSPPDRDGGVATWREFLAVRDEGLARAVGVSNYRVSQLDRLIAATGEAPAVNQILFSPRRYDPAVIAAHRERS